jgi:hypothetical protein
MQTRTIGIVFKNRSKSFQIIDPCCIGNDKMDYQNLVRTIEQEYEHNLTQQNLYHWGLGPWFWLKTPLSKH